MPKLTKNKAEIAAAGDQTKKNLCFILVEPENADNIGAAARAIKNMGFADLRLVNPTRQWRRRSRKMAPHAGDILQEAQVFETLEAALKDVSLAIGTSRRAGPKRGRFVHFNDAVLESKKALNVRRVAFVFGKESKGLDNVSLSLCDRVAMIPTNPECPSINLAQAVMITAFSFSTMTSQMNYAQRGNNQVRPINAPVMVEKKELHEVLAALEQTLLDLGYVYGQGSRTVERIKASWHRLFKRTGLLPSEVQMIKGFTRRIRERTLEKNVLSGAQAERSAELLKL